jgi:hypothetical protein
MSEAYPEAYESEAYEAYGEAGYEGEAAGEAAGGAGYEGEAGNEGEAGYEAYGEDARSDARRRRERQRQIMLARQRQAQLRRRPAASPQRPAPPPGSRQAIAAIRSDVRDMNLDNKVDLDSLRRALSEANRRGDRAMYSSLLSILGNQAIATYEPSLANHQVVSAAIRWAPSLLLSSSKRKPGIEGFLLSPPVLAGAVVAGVLISGNFINVSTDAHSISIGAPAPITMGDPSGSLAAVALNKAGQPLPNVALSWSSQNGRLAFASPSSGNYTVVSAGPDYITVTGGGATNGIFVTIAPAPFEGPLVSDAAAPTAKAPTAEAPSAEAPTAKAPTAKARRGGGG